MFIPQISMNVHKGKKQALEETRELELQEHYIAITLRKDDRMIQKL